MKSRIWQTLRPKILAGFLGVVSLSGSALAPAWAEAEVPAASAVVNLSSSWVARVSEKSPGLTALVSANAASYYEHLRDLALRGSTSAVDDLHPVDQLQVMFLRLTVPADRLAEMSGNEILLLAVVEGWIGQDLRRSDELREVAVKGDTATGRLFKFGLDDRPDRGRQYFSYEDGFWRVQLRGERERLEKDFRSFTTRTGLSDSEAAFFILETRLLRKVVPADFVAPEAASTASVAAVPEALPVARVSDPVGLLDPGASRARSDLPWLGAYKLIAVRESPDSPEFAAATIADVERSLRYVVVVGELLGNGTGYRLEGVAGDRARFRRGRERMVLVLDPESQPLDELRTISSGSGAESSLLDHANLGKDRFGMMSQWRNTGLRGRAQLLQQGSLIPEVVSGQHAIAGLRVGRILRGSFWNQMGLSEGDVIQEVNNRKMNSMMRWREFMNVAESAQEISLVVKRDGRQFRLITRTIPPH
ncbi:MAG: PDZ domain-containing protein [Candidatus Binatia bacterium]|nr:PDZ domain-containing protein [Candidatus Binatia bacterium]